MLRRQHDISTPEGFCYPALFSDIADQAIDIILLIMELIIYH